MHRNPATVDTDESPAMAPTGFETIFTESEKRDALRGRVFRGTKLDGVDFSNADLSFTAFEDVSLIGCNFEGANLRGTRFARCDLRWSKFDRTMLGKNYFDKAIFGGATGLTNDQMRYIARHGGTFAIDLTVRP
jgi:uncharacterized protein YjbI with pentapeptide repeats